MTIQPAVQKIFQKLETDGVLGQVGKINFSLHGVSVDLQTKDIIGSVIQEWFKSWLDTNNIAHSEPDNSQEFPDFFVGNNEMLEIKTFNWEAGPAFDIANFGSYVDSLIHRPHRLKADYIVFAYSMNGPLIKIEKMWCKKVWELSGPSQTNKIEMQAKRNQPYNLRPKKWYSDRVETFSNLQDFLKALNSACAKFQSPPSWNSEWLSNLEISFQADQGIRLKDYR